MGYQTDFNGEIKFNKPLTVPDYKWLKDFAEEDHRDSITKSDPKDMPGIWCQWVPNEDGTALVWDENEKFYNYTEWMEYLIANFFKPKGYILNGQIKWEGEEQGDVGLIIVKDNIVTTKEGKIVYDPDSSVEKQIKNIIEQIKDWDAENVEDLKNKLEEYLENIE